MDGNTPVGNTTMIEEHLLPSSLFDLQTLFSLHLTVELVGETVKLIGKTYCKTSVDVSDL